MGKQYVALMLLWHPLEERYIEPGQGVSLAHRSAEEIESLIAGGRVREKTAEEIARDGLPPPAPEPEPPPPPEAESELMQVRGMIPELVRQLHAAGVRTLADLANGDALQLALALDGVSAAQVRQWQEEARQMENLKSQIPNPKEAGE